MESNTPKIEARVKALEEKTSSAIDLKEVGDGLDLTSGVLSLKSHASADGNTYGKGSPNLFGHLKVIDSYEGDAPTAADGVVLSPAGIEKMIENAGLGDITPDWTQNGNSNLGTVLSDGSLLITKSGTFTVPATGVYFIKAVGGGGRGGNTYQEPATNAKAPGGGGGGGAGEYRSEAMSLTKGATIQVTIGASNGATAFSTIHCRAGGNGGDTGNGTSTASGEGGAFGQSFGTGGSAGGNLNSSIHDNPNYGKGGNGASSLYPVAGGNAAAGQNSWRGDGQNISGGSPGNGYGAGGGGAGGAGQGSHRFYGGSGSQGAVNILRTS